MLRRNGPVVKSVESVLRLEGSLWRETFVEEVGQISQENLNENASYEIIVKRIRRFLFQTHARLLPFSLASQKTASRSVIVIRLMLSLSTMYCGFSKRL